MSVALRIYRVVGVTNTNATAALSRYSQEKTALVGSSPYHAFFLFFYIRQILVPLFFFLYEFEMASNGPDQILHAIQQLQLEVQHQSTQLQQQRDEIIGLKAQIQLLTNVRPTNDERRKRPCLPDPEKFNGQSYKFDTWLPSIKAKLSVDGETIGNNKSQFYYVYLNLESSVQSSLSYQLATAEESQSWDFNTILDALTRIHDNPNKTNEAAERLHTIKQGDTHVAAYTQKFERLLFEARGDKWDDIVKINYFKAGLSTTLKNRLSQQLDLPDTYSDFLKTVQRLDRRSDHTYPSTGGGKLTQNGGDKMDLSVNTISAIRPESPETRARAHARSASPSQRQLWRTNNCCVRCGESDHWVNSCPLAPYKEGAIVSPQLVPSPRKTGAFTVNSINNYNRFHRQHPEEEANRYEIEDYEYSDHESDAGSLIGT